MESSESTLCSLFCDCVYGVPAHGGQVLSSAEFRSSVLWSGGGYLIAWLLSANLNLPQHYGRCYLTHWQVSGCPTQEVTCWIKKVPWCHEAKRWRILFFLSHCPRIWIHPPVFLHAEDRTLFVIQLPVLTLAYLPELVWRSQSIEANRPSPFVLCSY